MSTPKYFPLFAIISCFTIVFSFSCSRQQKHSRITITDTSSLVDTFKTSRVDSLVINTIPVDGKINVSITKKARQKVYILFNNSRYNRLTAKITSDDVTANIRFCQIFLPDGTMDGPFGRQFSYHLSQNGCYKLSIGESLMAGDPWAGSFAVSVKLY